MPYSQGFGYVIWGRESNEWPCENWAMIVQTHHDDEAVWWRVGSNQDDPDYGWDPI